VKHKPRFQKTASTRAVTRKKGGEIRIIDASSNCKSSETRITWNAEGPPGPAAPKPDGPCFSDGVTDHQYGYGFGRYFNCGNGTVNDTVTGLIMLQKANCFGSQDWLTANQSAAALGDGQCGLSDGSSPGDWRLMTKEEWAATIAETYENGCRYGGSSSGPSLTDRFGNGCFVDDETADNEVFSDVQSNYYWSSTTNAGNPGSAWRANLYGGLVNNGNSKPAVHFVWPVRGGQ
jgi:hypothetical protein